MNEDSEWEWDDECAPEQELEYEEERYYDYDYARDVIYRLEENELARIEWEEAIIERHNIECDLIDAFQNAVAHYCEELERMEAWNRMVKLQNENPAKADNWRKKWRKPWPMPRGL